MTTSNASALPDQTVTFYGSKPNHAITFYKAEKSIGTLDFNGDAMKFEGDAEESAKVFFDFMAKLFSQRIEEAFNAGRLSTQAQPVQELSDSDILDLFEVIASCDLVDHDSTEAFIYRDDVIAFARALLTGKPQ